MRFVLARLGLRLRLLLRLLCATLLEAVSALHLPSGVEHELDPIGAFIVDAPAAHRFREVVQHRPRRARQVAQIAVLPLGLLHHGHGGEGITRRRVRTLRTPARHWRLRAAHGDVSRPPPPATALTLARRHATRITRARRAPLRERERAVPSRNARIRPCDDPAARYVTDAHISHATEDPIDRSIAAFANPPLKGWRVRETTGFSMRNFANAANINKHGQVALKLQSFINAILKYEYF